MRQISKSLADVVDAIVAELADVSPDGRQSTLPDIGPAIDRLHGRLVIPFGKLAAAPTVQPLEECLEVLAISKVQSVACGIPEFLVILIELAGDGVNAASESQVGKSN
jgi:hypothetical protein